MKLTPWFNCCTEKPVRDGWYEVRLWSQIAWRGSDYTAVEKWEFTKGEWRKRGDWPGRFKKDQWRGVLK